MSTVMISSHLLIPEKTAANSFFHPEILATTLSSYARSLGFKSHFEDYLMLAKTYAKEDIAKRVALFTQRESEYIHAPDSVFRFHSGIVSNRIEPFNF